MVSSVLEKAEGLLFVAKRIGVTPSCSATLPRVGLPDAGGGDGPVGGP
jgi:hypothetical protein